jgi:Tol biopolymer transport system component
MADGQGNDQRLIIHNGDAPSWAPDKTLIAFARNGNVWIADIDGQNQKQLTDWKSLEAGVGPVFSPDGKWIVYRSWTERGGIELRVVSIDGKVDKEFLQDGEQPAW